MYLREGALEVGHEGVAVVVLGEGEGEVGLKGEVLLEVGGLGWDRVGGRWVG